jgi:hypothetical protein
LEAIASAASVDQPHFIVRPIEIPVGDFFGSRPNQNIPIKSSRQRFALLKKKNTSHTRFIVRINHSSIAVQSTALKRKSEPR